MLGTEAEFKKTIAAAKGDGLDSDDRYRKAMDGLDDNRLASAYVDFKTLLQAALREDPEAAQQFEQVKRLFPVDKIGSIAAGFVADGDKLAVDTPDASIPEDALRHRRAQLALRGAVEAGRRAAGRLLARARRRRRPVRRSSSSTSSSRARSAARRSRTSCARSSGSTSSRTSSPGSATSPCSRAAPTWPDRGRRGDRGHRRRPGQAAFGKLVGLAQSRGGVRARPVKVDGADTAFEATLPARRSRRGRAHRRPGRDRVRREAAADALGGGERLADSATSAPPSRCSATSSPAFVLSVPAVLALVESHRPGDEDFAEGQALPRGVRRDRDGRQRDGDRALRAAAAEVAGGRGVIGAAPGERGTSAAATSSSTAGTSSSATTSWICGAAARRRGRRRCARGARASAAWAASVRAEWRAVAVGAAQRGDQRGDRRRRARGAQARRALRRAGRRALLGARRVRSSRGQQPRVAAADLGQRAREGEPGLDRDAQQVQHVGELGLHPRAAPARAPAQPGVGREEAGAGAASSERRPEPPGRGGRERERHGGRARRRP